MAFISINSETQPGIGAEGLPSVITVRKRLLHAGYAPIPTIGKGTHVKGWSTRLSTNPEEIETLARLYPDHINTGILTARTPCLDIDLLVPEAAEAVEEELRQRFSDRGRFLVRYGRLPKRAIPFRVQTPFDKIKLKLTHTTSRPPGKEDGLEFLGNGQQIIVDGIHPDTQKPYYWHGCEQLSDVNRDELPEITIIEASVLIDEMVKLVEKFGYSRYTAKPKSESKPNPQTNTSEQPTKPEHSKANGAGEHTPSDWSDLFANIHAGGRLHDSLRDLAAKMAAAGTHPGAIVNTLRGAMNASVMPRDERFWERWKEIPRLVDSAIVKFAGPDDEINENRPELYIDKSDLTKIAKRLAALFAQQRRFLFNGHEPVEVVAVAGTMPCAIAVNDDLVRVFAHEVCIPVTLKQQKEGKPIVVPTTLSKDVANLYLRGLNRRWGLKLFNGITTAPIPANDGSFRTGAGYDEATGLWCHEIPAVEVPDRPTKEQALASLTALRRFFRTFPRFKDAALGVDVVNPEAPIGLDESSFLVSLLTAVCRASLTLAPGILATAPAFSGAGTGKGLATKAVCIVASGTPPSAFTSGHNTEEFDKRLTAALIDARPAIFLDNFNGKDLTSDLLASALTENPCEVRPMGQTLMVKLHTRTLIAITGNDVHIAEDMARRIVKTDYDAKVEDPEQRPFKPGFLDIVYQERAALLSHALTIWRWGRQNAGTLAAGKPLGSFETWAQWCRDPLVNLGTRDPVDRIAAIKAADPKRRSIREVFEMWWAVHGDELLPLKNLNQAVIQVIDEKAGFRDGAFQYSRQFVAGWLYGHIGTRIGGFVLENTPVGPDSARVNHYRVSKTA